MSTDRKTAIERAATLMADRVEYAFDLHRLGKTSFEATKRANCDYDNIYKLLDREIPKE